MLDQATCYGNDSATVWGAFAGIALLCTVLAYVLYFRILATAGATNLLLVTFLLSDVVTDTVKATAKDETPIPVSVTHRRELKRDGSAPMLVYAYGSYGISSDPVFHPELVPFLHRGGVWAVAHVRGGGEFGERWHLAGTGANKPNTWRDFIAAVETLEADGYTSPGRVAGMGASAGGIMPAIARGANLADKHVRKTPRSGSRTLPQYLKLPRFGGRSVA